MSDSSQPKNSYNDLIISSSDTIDLSGISYSMTTADYNYTYSGTDTITLTGTGACPTYNNGSSTYTIGALTTDQIAQLTTITLEPTTFNWNTPQEWVDTFPNWTRVQDMLVKYPGLKNAYDNFKVFYEMCKDDYDNPTPKK